MARNALHTAIMKIPKSKDYENLCIKIIHKVDKDTINATDFTGCTPLHYAAVQGKLKICQELLPFMTVETINTLEEDDCTPLDLALLNHKQDVYSFLLGQGGKLHSFFNSTPQQIKEWFEEGPSMPLSGLDDVH